MNHSWLYQGNPVVVDMKSPTMPECLPDGKHSLYVQIALDRLSWLPLSLPTSVTIGNLPWRIKAIVGPNDGQIPTWRIHRQHLPLDVPESERLCPFIYIDRSRQAPMTRMLTFDLARNDTGGFAVTDIYAGSRIPPLPWQVDETARPDALRDSITFWQNNAHWFDSRLVVDKQVYSAPSWATSSHTILL